MNFINPYQLLGINPNMPNLKDLKKSYYRLALLCHPDKGGNKHSMDIVHKSYLYIKKQFDNCQNLKSYEELEKEFEEFCKTQESIPPPFREIWENSEEFNNLKKFNEEFEKKIKNKGINNLNNNYNCFKKGYGEFMDKSNFKNNFELITKNNLCKNNLDSLEKNSHNFETKLIIYEEPEFTPLGYGQHFRYDIKDVNDFSEKLSSNIILNDYKKAFSEQKDKLKEKNITKNRPKTLEDLIKERKKIFNLKS